MAKTKVELGQFLKDAGVPAEKADTLVKELSKEELTAVATSLSEGTMRQSDYDKLMNDGKAELDKARADLADANDRLNAEIAEWGKVQAVGKAGTAKMRQDLEAAQVRVTQLTSRVQQLATDAGQDPAKVLADLDVTPPKQPTDPPTPTPGLTEEAVNALITKRLSGLGDGVLDVPVEIASIQAEHQALFGTPMSKDQLNALRDEIRTRATTKGNQKTLNPWEIWEEQHKVADKRTEVAQAQHDEEIAAAVARGREEALSEQRLPGSTQVPGRHSAVFSTNVDAEGNRQSAIERPQPMSTVTAAAAALRTGKYRGGGEAAKSA